MVPRQPSSRKIGGTGILPVKGLHTPKMPVLPPGSSGKFVPPPFYYGVTLLGGKSTTRPKEDLMKFRILTIHLRDLSGLFLEILAGEGKTRLTNHIGSLKIKRWAQNNAARAGPGNP